jgi:hypothetical protein
MNELLARVIDAHLLSGLSAGKRPSRLLRIYVALAGAVVVYPWFLVGLYANGRRTVLGGPEALFGWVGVAVFLMAVFAVPIFAFLVAIGMRGSSNGPPAVTPRVQEDRDAICVYEAHPAVRPASTARLDWCQRRGPARCNRVELAAPRSGRKKSGSSRPWNVMRSADQLTPTVSIVAFRHSLIVSSAPSTAKLRGCTSPVLGNRKSRSRDTGRCRRERCRGRVCRGMRLGSSSQPPPNVAARPDSQADCRATFTFSRLKGTERSRTPVASKTAFEIDEETMAAEGSPTPHGFSVGLSISSITISGTSGKVRMG